MRDIRVGQGFDIHRFSEDATRILVLGGQRFDGPGLEAVSDGDVVAHACAEALLGAAGLGDLGAHFPEDDASSMGADSIELLARVAAMVGDQGWNVGNVDCSVIAEAPRIAPAKAAMEATLSRAVGAPVSVKGRRAEALGALGRREGIGCLAVAVLSR